MSPSLTVEVAQGLAEVPEDAWDALVPPDHPFLEHRFLHALERTGCVGADTSWHPVHLLVRDGRRLVGAAPLYVKHDSYGEFIFDWGWASAAQRAGIPYYPKLVAAVPFTPATGPRLLVHPEASGPAVREALGRGALAVADAVDASSVHWLFSQPDEAEALTSFGYARRWTHQFHWEDHGFGDFEGYLGAMTSRRRKEVRRERRQAADAGLTLAVERGGDLSLRDIADLHRCYRATIDDHWATPYLSRGWFDLLRTDLSERVLVATARRDGRLVAGSLAFHRGRHLYGRYWGSLVDVPALHFELCYYRFVDWCLEHGVTRFEAGAQGPHKIRRGFLPRATHSAHWIRHPGLSRAVERFLVDEREQTEAAIASLGEHGPFKEIR